jgi:hypothetical protein
LFDPEDARRRWKACSRRTHGAIVEGSRQRLRLRHHGGPRITQAENHPSPTQLEVIGDNFRDGSSVERHMGGGRAYDLVPLVRRAAEVVENTYWDDRRRSTRHRRAGHDRSGAADSMKVIHATVAMIVFTTLGLPALPP